MSYWWTAGFFGHWFIITHSQKFNIYNLQIFNTKSDWLDLGVVDRCLRDLHLREIHPSRLLADSYQLMGVFVAMVQFYIAMKTCSEHILGFVSGLDGQSCLMDCLLCLNSGWWALDGCFTQFLTVVVATFNWCWIFIIKLIFNFFLLEIFRKTNFPHFFPFLNSSFFPFFTHRPTPSLPFSSPLSFFITSSLLK